MRAESIRRPPKTAARLRAPVFRVDEVALEMRGQNARAAGHRRLASVPHLVQYSPQRVGTARDSRRTERGHAVPRKSRGDGPERVAPVERVEPLYTVHMDVDEAGNDVVVLQRADVTRDASDRISAMRPWSMTSVPGDNMRSGRTSCAPDNTIMCAPLPPALRRLSPPHHRQAPPDDRQRLHHRRGQPSRDLSPHGIHQEIASRRHDASEDEHVGIVQEHEVRSRHPQVLRRVAHDGNRDAVAAARGRKHVLGADLARSPFAASCTDERSPALMRHTRRRTMPADATSASRQPIFR